MTGYATASSGISLQSSQEVVHLKDDDILQRQEQAARQREQREQRQREQRLSDEQAQEELRENTRKRQLQLQIDRREEEERQLVSQRQAAFDRRVRADPETLVGVRARVEDLEGTIESWHAAQGHWQILLDDGREEMLAAVSLQQLVDSPELTLEHTSSVDMSGRASDSMSPAASDRLLKGVRIQVDGMGKGVISEAFVAKKRDQFLDRVACLVPIAALGRRPSHKVLFDDGREEALNLNAVCNWVMDDFEVSEVIGGPPNGLPEKTTDSGEVAQKPPKLLQDVLDAVGVALKTVHANQSREEVQKAKAKPRLESLNAGLQQAKEMLTQFPAAVQLAKPSLDEVLNCLQRVSRLVGSQRNAQGKPVRPQDIGAELKLALEDLERARWDLVFQLNLETAAGKMQQNRTALQAAAARATLQKHEISANDIMFGPILGQGGFASVFLCDWQGAKTAAKCFDMRNLNVRQHGTLLRSFHRETEIAFNLRSPRVLQVFGICTTVPDRLYIIMELAVGGSVRGKLDAAQGPLLPAELWRLARDTALGMRYLHEHSIVHSDLKSHNVLLDAHDGCKVADFGIAKAAGKLHEMSCSGSNQQGIVGTVAWMAPEALHGEAGFPSDVFSFGVFFWELATRSVPWQEDGIAAIIYKVCFEQARLPTDCIEPSATLNQGQNAAIIQVLFKCWEHEAAKRPTFEELERETSQQGFNVGLKLGQLPAEAPPNRPPAKKKLIEVQVSPVIVQRQSRVEQVAKGPVLPGDVITRAKAANVVANVKRGSCESQSSGRILQRKSSQLSNDLPSRRSSSRLESDYDYGSDAGTPRSTGSGSQSLKMPDRSAQAKPWSLSKLNMGPQNVEVPRMLPGSAKPVSPSNMARNYGANPTLARGYGSQESLRGPLGHSAQPPAHQPKAIASYAPAVRCTSPGVPVRTTRTLGAPGAAAVPVAMRPESVVAHSPANGRSTVGGNTPGGATALGRSSNGGSLTIGNMGGYVQRAGATPGPARRPQSVSAVAAPYVPGPQALSPTRRPTTKVFGVKADPRVMTRQPMLGPPPNSVVPMLAQTGPLAG